MPHLNICQQCYNWYVYSITSLRYTYQIVNQEHCIFPANHQNPPTPKPPIYKEKIDRLKKELL